MARALATPAIGEWAAGPALGRRLQHVLCILVAASAIKTPLDIPLYWNAGLLLLGLFALVVVQSLQRVFIWMLVLVMLGAVLAGMSGTVATSGPRLAQLLLIVFAASLIARLDPDLLVRYLVLLLPIIILVTIAEGLLPEPLFHERKLFDHRVQRYGGLYGDPNYSAMLYGAIAVLLAHHRPRILALAPFLMAVPTLSRGIIVAVFGWLTAVLLRRRVVLVSTSIVILLCLQPVLVLALDRLLDESARAALLRLSTERLGIWSAYAKMGLSHPLGVGYFQGLEEMPRFAPGLPEWYAHSLYMQVFGEFGWLGYLAFVGLLLHVTARVARRAPDQLPILVFLLTGYAFVNGLSDWAFWVVIGYLLARADGAPTEPARP